MKKFIFFLSLLILAFPVFSKSKEPSKKQKIELLSYIKNAFEHEMHYIPFSLEEEARYVYIEKEINSHSFYDWVRRGTVPSADIALKIAKYLDTSVEFLLTGKEENPLSKKVDNLTQKIDEIRKIIES